MYYILLMTIAGSGLLIGVLLLGFLMGERVTEAFRYWSLVVVILIYFVPWVWIKGAYRNVSFEMWDRESAAVDREVILGDSVLLGEELKATPEYSTKLIVAGIWVCIAVLAVVYRSLRFFYKKEKLIRRSDSCEGELGELIERLRREFRLKQEVRVLRIPGQKFSCTMGLVQPVVFIQEDCRAGEEEFVLRHEFTHIVRKDMWVKLAMVLACCMHWCNPFIYLLNYALEHACEKACDERVVRGRTDDEKERYAHLIVRSARAAKKSKKRLLFGRYLASGEKYIEKRLRVIFNTRERKGWEMAVAAGILAVFLFLDSLSALAYPEVNFVENASKKLMVDFVQGDGSLYRSGAYSGDIDTTILYEEEIVRTDGVIPIYKNKEDMVFCTHVWERATYQIHLKNDIGGCEINRYDCDYCNECNKAIIGELVYTITFTKCSHNN